MTFKTLLKSYVKIEMVFEHVIKRISHGLGLDMIFIKLVVCFLSHSPSKEISQVKMNCCYLAVIYQFQVAVIYQFFGSSLAVL